jgi:aspartate kinase
MVRVCVEAHRKNQTRPRATGPEDCPPDMPRQVIASATKGDHKWVAAYTSAVSTTDYEAVPAVAGEATARAGTVVMKFGGTSVGDPQKLKNVAARVVAAHAEGTRVVAVLSAMGDTTDDLVRLAYEISPRPEPRELDMLISVGERISCALAAMAIHDLGDEAISLTGSQAGIVTDTAHGKAKIVDVRARRIHEALDEGKVVLVAGFQGVSTNLDITTLGRGGSDTTAVALAAALSASHCEIYTDVAGVFSADPRVVPNARKLHAVSYDEMLELAASGAKVLQLRSVEVARNYGVKLHVRSTFSDDDGTWVTEEDERMLEKAIISGVAHTFDEAVYRVRSVDRADLFAALADAGVNVDTIIQTGDEIVFSAPLSDRGEAEAALDGVSADRDFIEGLAKVSLIGAGMKSHPGIAARTFGTLRDIGADPRFIVTSPIKISFFVEQADAERTVLALHEAFDLASAGSEREHV